MEGVDETDTFLRSRERARLLRDQKDYQVYLPSSSYLRRHSSVITVDSLTEWQCICALKASTSQSVGREEDWLASKSKCFGEVSAVNGNWSNVRLRAPVARRRPPHAWVRQDLVFFYYHFNTWLPCNKYKYTHGGHLDHRSSYNSMIVQILTPEPELNSAWDTAAVPHEMAIRTVGCIQSGFSACSPFHDDAFRAT